MQSYIRIEISRGASDETLQAVAFTFRPLGILDEDAAWSCYFARETWSPEFEAAFRAAIRSAGPGAELSVSDLPAENWNEKWERSVEPVRVSRGIVIAPSWHAFAAAPGELVLTIDPKMSFGTGYHETTRTMLRLLERAVRGGERVLDVGTGTGILAIAAVKLGAVLAVGVDTDEWSRENARENSERNGVAERVDIRFGSVEAVEGTFELILSNITRNDNLALLEDYAARITAAGLALLSGFYTDDEAAIIAAAQKAGFEPVDTERENEWSAMTLRRT